MELNQIRHLVAVAREGSLSRAAAAFNMTQAAMTRSMDSLEASVGAQLLARNARGTSLTPAGERFASLVAPLVEELDRARSGVIARAERPSGPVRVGVSPSVMSAIGSSMVREVRARFPEIQLTLDCAFSGELIDQLRKHAIDLAVTAVLGHTPGIAQRPLGTFGLCHFAHRSTLGSSKGSAAVTMQDLRDQNLVLPSPRHVLRRLLDRAAKLSGFTLHPGVESNSIGAILNLTRTGEVSTILPYGAVVRELTNSSLVARPIHDSTLLLPLALLTSASRVDTQADREVARLLTLHVQRAARVGTLAPASRSPP